MQSKLDNRGLEPLTTNCRVKHRLGKRRKAIPFPNGEAWIRARLREEKCSWKTLFRLSSKDWIRTYFDALCSLHLSRLPRSTREAIHSNHVESILDGISIHDIGCHFEELDSGA